MRWKNLSKADKETIESFKRWMVNVFSLNNEEKEEIEKKFMRDEAEMTNIQKVVREWRKDAEIAGREEGRKDGKRSTVIKILTKKLNEQADAEILQLIENATMNELEKVEDKIFEITSWSDVHDLLN